MSLFDSIWPWRDGALDDGDRPATVTGRLTFAGGPRNNYATVEAFTVPYQGDGSPDAPIVSALTPEGERVLVRTSDQEVVDAMLGADPFGWRVEVAGAARSRIADPTPGPLPSRSPR